MDCRYKYTENIAKTVHTLLYGNPLQCDSQLEKVWRWCEDRNIRTAYDALNEVGVPECDTQGEVMGIWWGLLDKGRCFQGNIQYYEDYNNTCNGYNNITVPNNDKDTEPNRETNKQDFFPRFLTQYKIPIYAVLFIFGTTGNVILLNIIICNKDMRTLTNMYILN